MDVAQLAVIGLAQLLINELYAEKTPEQIRNEIDAFVDQTEKVLNELGGE